MNDNNFIDLIDSVRDVRSNRTEYKLIRPIEPIENWVYSEYYIGPDAGSVYDFWRQHLIEIFRTSRKPEEYIDQILIDGSIGGGKGFPKKNIIPTPTGDKRFGDLKVGDFIFGSNGKPTKVIGIYDRGVEPLYRVTFSDGAFFECDGDHLWSIDYRLNRGNLLTLDTKTLKNMIDNNIEISKGVFVQNCYIPITEPLQYDKSIEHEPLYDPYIIGALIADGGLGNYTKHSVVYTKFEKETLNGIKSRCAFLKTSREGYHYIEDDNLINALEAYGLLGKTSRFKFIPHEMFYMSVENRLLLLQGLMDGDGSPLRPERLYKGIHSLYAYGTLSDQLSDDFIRLATSLGMIATHFVGKGGSHKKYGYKDCNYIHLHTNINPFLYSKWKKYFDNIKSKYNRAHRYIQFIEMVGNEEQQCVKVDSQDELFIGDTKYNIVTHNTTFANLCMMRKLYELSCYENMQALFNLMLSSKIAFTYFNITKDQAEQTGFGQLREMIDSSPYFQEHFRRNMKAQSIIEWPLEKLSVTFGSGASSMIGGNLLGSILDEANFYQGDGKEAVAGEVQSKAAKLYTNIRNRGRSRFLRNGVNRALNIVVSSSMYANSFMNKLKQECKDDPHTYYIETTIWDVKPKGTYSEERFYVFKGSDNLDPSLCDTVNDVSNIMEILGYGRCDNFEDPVVAIKSFPLEVQQQYFIGIPTDFRKSFDDNLIQALQDIAGVSVSPIGRLFSSRYHYNLALDQAIEHPLVAPEVTLSTKSNVTWKDLFKPSYRFEHPEKPRFIHFDQSYAGDKSGISCCYIDKVVETEEGPIPYIKFDFMFTIVPPKAPAQTAIYKLRELIPYLANTHGLNFGLITYDMFASIESMQILQSQGYPVEYQSVDRTDDAYLALVNLLYEERIKFGYSKEFESNLFNLIHFRQKKKVDHPADGGKDTSDSVAGAAYNALRAESVEAALRGNDVDFWINEMQ